MSSFSGPLPRLNASGQWSLRSPPSSPPSHLFWRNPRLRGLSAQLQTHASLIFTGFALAGTRLPLAVHPGPQILLSVLTPKQLADAIAPNLKAGDLHRSITASNRVIAKHPRFYLASQLLLHILDWPQLHTSVRLLPSPRACLHILSKTSVSSSVQMVRATAASSSGFRSRNTSPLLPRQGYFIHPSGA